MSVGRILWVEQDLVNLELPTGVFHIKLNGYLSSIYDNKFRPIKCSNIDSWIHNNSHGRWNLDLLQDLVAAYRSGVDSRIDNDTTLEYIKSYTDKLIHTLFETDTIRLYSQLFSIEIADHRSLLAQLEYIEARAIWHDSGKQPTDIFYHTLCRLYKQLQRHQDIVNANRCERIINSLGYQDLDPPHLDASELNRDLISQILRELPIPQIEHDVQRT